jgi:hypothetical protein
MGMPYFAMVSWVDTRYHSPSCTMWAWAKSQANPHSSKQDTLPIVFLISKQAAPYQTCYGTCYPRVSTPKIRSLVNSSMTIHITWWNSTISTITTLAQTTTLVLTGLITSRRMEDHISHTKTQTILNIIKMEDLHDTQDCMTRHTNQVWTQIPKVWGLGNNINACRPVCILEREKAHRINMVKGHLTCSPASCCSKSWKSSSWRFSKSSAPNDSDRKQALQINKWIVYQTISNV